jgi:TolB-like protein/Flp pilus assembly protein TadD
VSIAVLPLSNLQTSSATAGDEFLGIGLADALIARLSGISRLVVMPTSSVLGLTGEDAIEAGRTLRVDYILDGNIRKFGDRVRVSVQLLSIADTATRWAQAFDESEADMLALEDKISDQVARSLLPQLTTEERGRLDRRGTQVPAAYRAYLRGRYFVNRFTGEHLPLAIEAFNEALTLDPEYAYPYIGLADVYVWSSIFGEIPSREGLTKATELAKRAIEIDNSLGEAYSVLAFCIFLSEWNWYDAEQIALRALELSPNYPFAHECISNFYAAQGRFDEAVKEILIAEELDPLSPRAKLISGWTLYHARRFEEALEKIRAANRMQPDFPQGMWHLGNSLILTGEYEEAIEVLGNCAALWPTSVLPKYMLCFALTGAGQKDAARALANELAARENTKAFFTAMAFVAIGEFEDAFRFFRRAVDEQNEWLIWFGVDPKLDPIRKDPRYKEILNSINSPIATGEFRSDEFRLDTAERVHSIAVLPFKVIGDSSDNAGDQFLSLGLADAVTMRLSNIGRFLVRPTSSVLVYTNKDADPLVAGRELGVKYVIDGLIRHVGESIRVTVQLLDIEDSRTYWAASFDEVFTDVLELEDIISERVTHSILPKLSGEEEERLAKRGTNSPAAHEAYLQGRFFWNRFTPDTLQQAIAYFTKAIELDPEYALAYVGIADFYSWAGIYGMISPAESIDQVYKAATRAVELDDELAEAHAALGLYYSNSQAWEESEREHRRAIQLNPNYPLAHEWLSAVLVGSGRFDEGTQEILTAESLDPLSLRAKVLTAWTLYQATELDMALEKTEEIITLDPDFWQGYLQSANILLEIGRTDEALGHAQKASELGGGSPLPTYQLCFALTAAGRRDEALALAESLAAESQSHYVSPYFIGMSLLGAGDIDRAFGEFEKAQAEKSAWLVWWATELKLKSIRGDVRYQKILAATKNPILKK